MTGSRPQVRIKHSLPFEVVHHYDSASADMIASNANRFSVQSAGKSHEFTLPVSTALRSSLPFRPLRRLLRTDKSYARFNLDRSGVVAIYRGEVFFFDLANGELTQTAQLRQSRNPLHLGVAAIDQVIAFGEYGANPDSGSVPVWASSDGGRSFAIVDELGPGSARHVHGVYAHPDGGYWLATGDADLESHIYYYDRYMKNRVELGGGSQLWRLVSPIFRPEGAYWGTDSPNEPSYIMHWPKNAVQPHRVSPVSGPIWYGRAFSDGPMMFASSIEIGDAIIGDSALIYASNDGEEWHEVFAAKKDRWPMPWFKFGVIAFADGEQESGDFVFFGEALRGCEGKSFIGELVW